MSQRQFELVLRIRALMATLRVKQYGLAEKIGVTPSAVSYWMKGGGVSAEALIAMANLSETGEDMLFFYEMAKVDTQRIAAAVGDRLRWPRVEGVEIVLDDRGTVIASRRLDEVAV